MDQLPDPFSGDKYEEPFHEESPNFGSIYSLSQLDNNYIDSADYLNDAFDDLAPPYPTFGDKISNDTFTKFYVKLAQCSKIGIDLFIIWMTEHDIAYYVYSLLCYTQSKKEIDEIYDLFCKFD